MARQYLYKLTEQDRTTWNHSTLWGEGVTHEVTKSGTTLCSSEVIHAYVDKNLALLMNPVHSDIKDPVLFLAFGEVVKQDSFKVGVKKLTTQKEIKLPLWYTGRNRLNVIVRFAQLCAEATAAAAAKGAARSATWAAAWATAAAKWARGAKWAAAEEAETAKWATCAAWAAAEAAEAIDFSALAAQAIVEAASGKVSYY